MAQHIYARVSGHGFTLLPFAPFSMRRQDKETSTVEVTHITPERPLRATVMPSNSAYRAETESDDYDAAQVVEIFPGPPGPWRIETSAFLCAWPPQFTLCSNRFPADPSPFDLVGPEREMIFVQTPRKMRPVSELIARGQRTVAVADKDGLGYIEVEYEHEGVTYRQRHEVREFPGESDRFGVTLQARARFFASRTSDLADIVASIRRFDEGADS